MPLVHEQAATEVISLMLVVQFCNRIALSWVRPALPHGVGGCDPAVSAHPGDRLLCEESPEAAAIR